MSLSTDIIPTRIVALYPNTRGFGYAVMESALEVTEMQLISPKKFDFNKIMSLMREVLSIHGPATLILEDCRSKYCRKGAQTKQLIRSIAAWARKKNIPVEFYSREQIRDTFEKWNANNKYEIAEVLTRNIDILKPLMFEKPKYPAREPNVEAIFSAVSLGVVHYF
tara:strand:+ start:735682 stop:736179 length:498 start_codon:yes stop_codon:yes gene_type:complete